MRASKDTLPRRIGRVAAVVIVMVAAVGTAATLALLHAAHELDRLSDGYAPAGDANNAALTYMLDAETGIRGYALTGKQAALEPYRRAQMKILPAIDEVRAALHSVGDSSQDAAIAAERRQAQLWINAVARPAVRGLAQARRRTQTTAARTRFDAFRVANGRVAAALAATRRQLRSETEALSTWVLPLVLGGAFLVVLGSGYAILRTARSVSRPLTALTDVVRRIQGGEYTETADETAGPVEVRTVSAAVNSLAAERARILDQRRADDRLRSEVRELTSAVRIGQDPDAVANTLVAGLGRVFGVDIVWLVTFEDERVAALAARWRRDDRDGDPPPEAGSDDLLLRGLANQLWHGSTVVGVADHLEPTDPPTGPYVAVVPQVTGARASMIAAIGEGNTALGLLWLATADGPRTWAPAELGLLQHVAGELAQSFVQAHLLARQRAVVRRLREADEARTALVSTVSHELRTPLTSIIGYLDVLLDSFGEELDEEAVSMLRVVERNATRLRSMIEDLLKQSELETGRRLVQLDRTDLVDVLRDVRETITPLADNAELELEVSGPTPGTVVVDGDLRELTQAVVNLAANAVKFTPAGGRVTLAAARDGETAELRVIDTGMGIPDDEIPHLFQRFFRARNARSAVIPGTGLGLAIVADIVARHNGSINVTSTLGSGTSVVIRLPLAKD